MPKPSKPIDTVRWEVRVARDGEHLFVATFHSWLAFQKSLVIFRQYFQRRYGFEVTLLVVDELTILYPSIDDYMRRVAGSGE